MSHKEALAKHFKHPEDNPLRIMNTFGVEPSEIMHGLWIGNFYDGMNGDLLRALGIDAVINLTGTIRVLHPGIMHMVVLVDQPFNTTRDQAERAVEMIKALRAQNKSVLVHCLGGVDRAPTVVMKYLVDTHMTVEEAERLIKEARPQALPHWDWWSGGTSAPGNDPHV